MMDRPTLTTVSIEHVTVPSERPFQEVRERLERSVPHIDDGIFVLLRFGAAERALAELQKLPSLSIFGSRDHGALLAIADIHAKAVQYDIGNPLTASQMTRHDISAALYAPVRVLLRQNAAGQVAFEYDRPSTTFGQFGNAEIAKVAAGLDQSLAEALHSAAA